MPEVRVGAVAEVASAPYAVVRVEDLEVGILRHAGRFYAYANRCLHQGGPACEGVLAGKVGAVLSDDGSFVEELWSDREIHFVCPLHGGEYDLATGECAADRRFRLRRYEVVQHGEELYLMV